MNHAHYMREALKEAAQAAEHGEVPVGCVIVKASRVIARAHNQVELLRDPTAHAEILAITQAANTLGEGRLEKTAVYVTKEPCPMCAGALVLARCEELFFGAFDDKAGACGTLFNIVESDKLNHQMKVLGGVLEAEARALLQGFFQKLRKENS